MGTFYDDGSRVGIIIVEGQQLSDVCEGEWLMRCAHSAITVCGCGEEGRSHVEQVAVGVLFVEEQVRREVANKFGVKVAVMRMAEAEPFFGDFEDDGLRHDARWYK